MAKIALVADIHHGVPGRLHDTIWSCRVVREYCKAAGIDVVIVLGDLYHNRESLAIDVLQAVVQFHQETAEKYDQKWITFPGNHDMFLRHSWHINSLVPMSKYLTVINDVKLLEIADKRFWVLPFIQHERSFMKVLRRIEERHEEGDVLLTHIGVRGATLNTCFLIKDWSHVTFEKSKFKQIYTGHFHSKQQLGEGDEPTVWYPGSPIPFKFDEGDIGHGFYVYDTDTSTHKFVNIWKAGAKLLPLAPGETAPPQYCTLLDELLDTKTPEDVRGNIVRVALQRDYSDNEKSKIRDTLTQMGAATVRFWNMAQKMEKRQEQLVAAEQPAKHLFRAFVDADKKGLVGLDVDGILMKAHEDVTQEGDDLYSREETDF